MNSQLPKVFSVWLHKNGGRYIVLCITNTCANRPDEYPVTVVYQDQNGKVWSRPLDRWYASFTEVL